MHIGIKQDDEWTVKNQREFFKFFFNECKTHGVNAVLQTGDWFDVRKGISQETLRFIREELVPEFQSLGHTYVNVGNHDMHKREMITPNSCREILGLYDKFTVIEEPTTLSFEDEFIDIIPWICKENHSDVMSFIAKSKSPYCMGHFELTGFYYYTGLKSEGDKADFLRNYKQVWSGHFHCQSESGNVKYIGTPYTLTLGDANDERGFFIFDTKTKELTFHKNPDCWHRKFYFNADTFNYKQITQLEGKAVRIVVEKRSSDSRKIDFDAVAERISNLAHSLDIIDTVEFESGSEVVIEVEDTQKFVDEFIESLSETEAVKERSKKIFSALQREAIDLE